MADNVTINDSTGTSTIASDQVTDPTFGTAQVQFVKVTDARDGGTNRAAVDSGNNLQVNPQALVDDGPPSYAVGTQQPLSLTTEGRLRVATVTSDLDQVWNHAFENPWELENAWEMSNLYV